MAIFAKITENVHFAMFTNYLYDRKIQSSKEKAYQIQYNSEQLSLYIYYPIQRNKKTLWKYKKKNYESTR